jgi:predicted ATP-grasp superfamily ATP-dependent carboligase
MPRAAAARPGTRLRVLVTEGDNVGVLAMIRGLAKAGYEPWVAAAAPTAPAVWSRVTAGVAIVPDPRISAVGFARRVAELIDLIRPVAVVPGGERGMLALADMAAFRPPLAEILAVCDRETVYRTTDKSRLGELAALAGLRIPETAALTAEEAADRTPLPLRLPLVVKPLRSEVPTGGGFCSCAVRIARSRKEVVEALRALPDGRGLVQAHHVGSLSGVGGVFWGGSIIASVHQRAVRTFPVGRGEMAFANALPRDMALEAAITRFLRGVGWAGLFQLQFLDTAEGRLLIDVNPRIYGSLSLALAAGQNLPAIWIDLLRGRAPEIKPYRPDVSFRNEVLDGRALLTHARTRELRGAVTALRVHADSYAYFAPGDSLPLLIQGPALALKLRSRARRRLAERAAPVPTSAERRWEPASVPAAHGAPSSMRS